jgi:hypothetical protein
MAEVVSAPADVEGEAEDCAAELQPATRRQAAAEMARRRATFFMSVPFVVNAR